MKIEINANNAAKLRNWHAQNDDRDINGLANILLEAYFIVYGTEQHNLTEDGEFQKLLAGFGKANDKL